MVACKAENPEGPIKDLILSKNIGPLTYVSEIITAKNKNQFLSISGSKKGSEHRGGGIIISNMSFLHDFINLVKLVLSLNENEDLEETCIGVLVDRNRVLTGEIRNFHGKWFYRVKEYINNFKTKDTDEIRYYKEHRLRPSGFGFYIKEFDIPISVEGKKLATDFTESLLSKIETILKNKTGKSDLKIDALLKNNILATEEEFLWVTVKQQSILGVSENKILDDICFCLLEGSYSVNQLASKVNISENVAKYFLSAFARYETKYLERGILIDRSRGQHRNLEFQATQIPKPAMEKSPNLIKLLDDNAGDKWPAWKQVIFSSDDFSQSRTASLHFSEFEVASLLQSKKWGISSDECQVRRAVVRLFDLKRYFHNKEEELNKVNQLASALLNSYK